MTVVGRNCFAAGCAAFFFGLLFEGFFLDAMDFHRR